jgi:hypothetical protein
LKGLATEAFGKRVHEMARVFSGARKNYTSFIMERKAQNAVWPKRIT